MAREAVVWVSRLGGWPARTLWSNDIIILLNNQPLRAFGRGGNGSATQAMLTAWFISGDGELCHSLDHMDHLLPAGGTSNRGGGCQDCCG